MSRKENIKSKQLKSEGKSPKKKNLIVIILVLLIAALVAVGVGLKLSSKKSSDKPVSADDDSSLRRGETRPTLSPAQFSHPKIAEAYQIAKDIPHVLDALYCYCFCDRKPLYHKSVLSCFVDMHAAS